MTAGLDFAGLSFRVLAQWMMVRSERALCTVSISVADISHIAVATQTSAS